jgi:hypothetical protein
MKYRRKTPEAIEAIQWKGDNKQEMFEFLGWYYWNKIENVARGWGFDYNDREDGLLVREINVEIGDYVVKDGDEFIVYSENEFNETYELAFQNPIPIGIDLQQHGTFPNYTDQNDLVPYSTICGCNPANGGGGICGCTMANQLVPRNQNVVSTLTTGKILLNENNRDLYTLNTSNT